MWIQSGLKVGPGHTKSETRHPLICLVYTACGAPPRIAEETCFFLGQLWALDSTPTRQTDGQTDTGRRTAKTALTHSVARSKLMVTHGSL